MEQCAAPRLESISTPDPVTRAESAAETEGDAEQTIKDVYECRICGYKAIDVKCLSRHLHAAHPVTSIVESKSLRNERCETREEERGEGVRDDEETSCLDSEPSSRLSPDKEKSITPEGSESASLKTPEDFNETSSSIEIQEQEERMEVSPVPKAMRSSSPVLSQEISHCSSGSKPACHKRHTLSSGKSTHNQTNLICLPLVSEGLKLIWVRSEQIHELDAVSDLVEAFNAFPYPTSQEASALARKCALPPDRVKAWFMMQRVRYGISWGDDDIQETRTKLWNIQKQTVPRECEEVNDEKHEVREKEQKSFKHPSVADTHIEHRHHTPHSTIPLHTTNDRHRFGVSQNNNTSQSHHRDEQLLATNFVFSNGLQPLSQVPQMNLHSDNRNVPSHSTEVQVFDAYGQSSYVIMNDQHTTAQYHSEPHPLTQSFQIFPGKKSKAQLMALRRSFVRKSWPSDVEVQRLQRSTGLNRREIRKWFADSRYQLRKNGRAWLTKLAKHNHSLQQDQQNSEDSLLPKGGFNSNDEADNAQLSEAQFEVDVSVNDKEVAADQSNETRQEISDEGEFDKNKSSIKQSSADLAASPLSSSFPQGRVEPNVRLRKKTREQLEILRQSFLHCQWPTNDDYLILQQKTGLTKTEIIQWYGDTRYHVKHNHMRWMTAQERHRIIAVIMQQQRRGGKNSRSRILLDGISSGLDLGDSTFINGSGSGEATTWSELFSGSTSALPEGEL